MGRFFLFFSLLCLFTTEAWTQSITGKVSHAQTGEPLEAAQVFIANTQQGVLTGKDGSFRLENLPEHEFEVVVNYLGFRLQKKRLQLSPGQEKVLDIKLEPTPIELDEVSITALPPKKNKRYLKRFTKAFFGQTENARRCQLLNPEVLRFEETAEAGFKAFASDILQIENLATGYRVYFLLEHFERKGNETTFGGKSYFEPLIAEKEIQQDQWNKNRQQTYNGSLQHFMTALYADELEPQGFKLEYARLSGSGQFSPSGFALPKSVTQNSEISNQKYLKTTNFLRITYFNEPDRISDGLQAENSQALTGLGRPAEKDMIQQEKESTNQTHRFQNQVSYLYPLKSRVPFHQNGVFIRPELVKEYGYWAYEGVADMLPIEYGQLNKRSRRKKNDSSAEAPSELNGFALTNLSIPLLAIKSGGPPRDGIPSIDKPVFLAAYEATFMKETDKILGVYYQGIAKAYPIKIMNYHEIVNDQYNEKSVVLTYCPLCGSGLAFEAEVEGKVRTFGVSGLLYNSDVLLYDRQSESLWSQILQQGVAGSNSGTKLSYIQTQLMSWGDWQELYPETLVLGTATGFGRDYERNPYPGYASSPKIMFPVSNKNDALAAKSLVVGIEISGKFKAYSIEKLRTEKSLEDEFAGKKLLIEWDEKGQLYIKDEGGKEIPYLNLYWFAWVAFHPDTAYY